MARRLGSVGVEQERHRAGRVTREAPPEARLGPTPPDSLRPSLPAAAVETLARTAGNRAVAGLAGPALQRRTAGDPTSPDTRAEGAKGPAVEEVQQHLNRHGASPALKIDGVFGPKTRAAVVAFQSSHTGVDGQPLVAGSAIGSAFSSIPGSSLLGLDRDEPGAVGARTWRALQQSAPTAAPAGGGAHPRDELAPILAKGDAMTPDEATKAKDLLFALEDDEFRKVLRQAAASGAFLAMLRKLDLGAIVDLLAGLVQEVVVNTVLLKPAANTIDADFKRANEIYNPHGIEIEKGTHIDLSEKATRSLLGADRSLDEFDTSVTPMTATAEELKLVEMNRVQGRVTGYWVPKMTSSRGEALDKADLGNLGDERESVVVNTSNRAQDTFPHELGHALGLPHDPVATNLMAAGTIRTTSGPGIDQLNPTQLATLRSSVFGEIGRKGVGK